MDIINKLNQILTKSIEVTNGDNEYCVFFIYSGHVDWIEIRIVDKIYFNEIRIYSKRLKLIFPEINKELDKIIRVLDSIIKNGDLKGLPTVEEKTEIKQEIPESYFKIVDEKL